MPVKSCWNGLVVFQADPFYTRPPLRFRGIPDSLALHHLEGSECCLIHSDNELNALDGVWLNPNVRVAYSPEAYQIVNPKIGTWPSKTEKLKGIWQNRWARLTGFPRRYVESFVVYWRTRAWQRVTQSDVEDQLRNVESKHCMINEMQVLVKNGWAHV